ncbi:hypothetical protein [Microbacterium terrisoli]|uniref:hypothetical protein n=1 Tax=Microbacterium terrisoli TaxID=3242192 RepID=UPI0028054020|nr:hypothetical protein [Microbacterium protaetiae]
MATPGGIFIHGCLLQRACGRLGFDRFGVNRFGVDDGRICDADVRCRRGHRYRIARIVRLVGAARLGGDVISVTSRGLHVTGGRLRIGRVCGRRIRSRLNRLRMRIPCDRVVDEGCERRAVERLVAGMPVVVRIVDEVRGVASGVCGACFVDRGCVAEAVGPDDVASDVGVISGFPLGLVGPDNIRVCHLGDIGISASNVHDGLVGVSVSNFVGVGAGRAVLGRLDLDHIKVIVEVVGSGRTSPVVVPVDFIVDHIRVNHVVVLVHVDLVELDVDHIRIIRVGVGVDRATGRVIRVRAGRGIHLDHVSIVDHVDLIDLIGLIDLSSLVGLVHVDRFRTIDRAVRFNDLDRVITLDRAITFVRDSIVGGGIHVHRTHRRDRSIIVRHTLAAVVERDLVSDDVVVGELVLVDRRQSDTHLCRGRRRGAEDAEDAGVGSRHLGKDPEFGGLVRGMVGVIGRHSGLSPRSVGAG